MPRCTSGMQGSCGCFAMVTWHEEIYSSLKNIYIIEKLKKIWIPSLVEVDCDLLPIILIYLMMATQTTLEYVHCRHALYCVCEGCTGPAYSQCNVGMATDKGGWIHCMLGEL